MAQEGPSKAQDGSSKVQGGPSKPQDGPTMDPKMAQDCPKTQIKIFRFLRNLDQLNVDVVLYANRASNKPTHIEAFRLSCIKPLLFKSKMPESGVGGMARSH